jgi:hypothetical protein
MNKFRTIVEMSLNMQYILRLKFFYFVHNRNLNQYQTYEQSIH